MDKAEENTVKFKVCLVDEMPLILDGIETLLKDAPNLEVIGKYRDGAQFLGELKNRKCNLLITEIALPHMDGLNIARKIAAEQLNVDILFYTHIREINIFGRAMGLGARDYVLKTDEPSTLIRT